ncbi:DNA circularization N-terminal domain-containing protein [Vibrio parahaemolyticus]|uniref:Multidrug DMT transporter permease n=1 Tax=Vibrio parahaemolyticus TaxID=670 RepID=A0A8H9K120_VIBPH|nr:DNA circularization N-terminal domain-containing protein [Vibrio parahaemolyticus]HAS6672781.1 multidrug DMT transporter permease [Vibrio parahaemolyticus]HAS6674830.1 multidrug DMT transporter permease [Vibrio parahaemolyticus]HAS6678634.1 multidrug DMT transporter permease [Vibrio parahaemolyticus]HAS6680530.1 multidrug DMT transporter permease [Vibrio parahaemolyticus]
MAFEDRLTASFRGVTFMLDEAEGDSGRRAIPHAYPKKEIGYTEDNGKVLTAERISGRVIGENYFDELADILDALNKPGPGEFIHPWFGVRKVQIGKVSHRLVNKVDGLATFNFEVFEVGENLFPTAKRDTAKQVQAEADNSQLAANEVFEEAFDITALDGVGDMVDQFFDDLDEFTRGLPSLPEELREWTDRLQRAKDSIGNLLAVPGELAASAMTLLEDVKGVVTDPMRALDVYNNVINRWDGARAELAVTGGLTRNITSEDGFASSVPTVSNPNKEAAIMANAEAFKRLVLNSAVVSKASAMGDADISFNLTDSVESVGSLSGVERNQLLTGPQLKQIGYGIANQLAERASEAVDLGDSAVWRQFRALRKAVLADTRERAELLPKVSLYTPISTVPVSLVAWQRNGDTETRQSIVQRNGLSNPAFILPSDSIEVING